MTFGNDDVIGGGEGSAEVTALAGEAAGEQVAVDTHPNVDTQSVVGAQPNSTAQFDTEQLPIVVAQTNGYVQSGAGEQVGAAISAGAGAGPNTDSQASDDVQPGTTAEQAGAPGTAYAAAVRHGWGSGLWKRSKPLPLGRPRVSTLVLMSVWVAVLALYLVVRPA